MGAAMGVACRGLLVCAALVVTSCDDARPSPRIESVSPDRAYTDRAVRVTIRGGEFLPTFRIDPGAGTRIGETSGFSGEVRNARAAAVLREFGWIDLGELTATVDQVLPRGRYDVTIEDPRGQRVTLPLGFQALGPDVDPPSVALVSPDGNTPAAGGVTLPLRIQASDPEPGQLRDLAWRARVGDVLIGGGQCVIPPGVSQRSCEVDVRLPATLEQGSVVRLTATARDDAPRPNAAEATVEVVLRGQPFVAAVVPARGGTSGGTDVVISGSGFLPGSRAFVGGLPLIPDGGIVVDEQTISGRVPAGVAGPRSISVRTPLGMPQLPDAFVYYPAPQIEAISPETGDPEGATLVRIRGESFTRQTQIYFGGSLVASVPLAAATFVDEGEIQGLAPGGRGRTTVWAFDPELGWTRLTDGFVWMSGR